MKTALRGQVTSQAAHIYETEFVPALFQTWAAPLLDGIFLAPGEDLLDVACGTGIVARTAAPRVGSRGSVTGLDCNDGMLAEARRLAPSLRWREGDVADLPYPDGAFDVVTCQFGLMFFDNPVKALAEMRRVLRPGGRLAVAVWAGLDESPEFSRLVNLVSRHAGAAAAEALRVPFSLGGNGTLRDLFASAGFDQAQPVRRLRTARFRSVTEWIRINIDGWTFADQFDARRREALLAEARAVFAADEGKTPFEFPSCAHLVFASRR